MVGWFFECFEKTVGGRHVHLVGVVDDINLVASDEWPVDKVILHFSDLPDLDLVARGRNIKYVGMNVLFGLPARPTSPTRIGSVVDRIVAIDSLCKHSGGEPLPDAVITEK